MHRLTSFGMGLLAVLWFTAMTLHAQDAPTPGQTEPPVPEQAASDPPVAEQPAAAQSGSVGWIELSGPLPDAPPPVAWATDDPDRPTLRRVLAQLRHAAASPRTRGVVIYLEDVSIDRAQIDQLAAAIAAVRGAGKRVLVFAEAYDLSAYLVACSADMILLQHKGELQLAGLGLEELYLAGLLEKIGARADLLQIGKYKGADEALTRSGPSPEWSQNMDGLLDDVYEQIIQRIAQGRGLERSAVVNALAEAWTLSDEDLVRGRLVDRLVDRDLQQVTEEAFGSDFDWDQDLGQTSVLRQMDNPLAFLQMLFRDSRKRMTRPGIAVIHARGAITSGQSQVGGSRAGLFSVESIGSRTMSKALQDAADNELVKGVVVHIDSPGGSALASEVIWQAVRQVQEGRRDADGNEDRPGKPVYVSIGSMAASGGYYIASAADEVYALPSSIVGSIGVVGGKIVLGGLYEKLGIAVHRRSRGPMGDLFNSVEPFTFRQRTALETALQRIYEQFLDRVKRGRGSRIPDSELAAVAQGRIFTGRQAQANHLVDRLGGLDAAVSDLAAQLGLEEGKYDVLQLPEPMSLPEYIESIFGVHAPGSIGGAAGLAAVGGEGRMLAQAAAALLGPRHWQQAATVISGLMLLEREPVLALWPVVLRIR